MASFTDKPAQFNPYIPQLPLQAMVEVGMEKQRRYDEGIERIQSNIDKVMEFDIAKDAHKNYLQSKLSQLGQDLRGFAAGDFSNSQLVKTVSGMANKIGRDPIVQNAVTSTALYRREVAMMMEDRKNGKLSPANELYFNKHASEWFNDQDLARPFSARYIPDIDIPKQLSDLFDKIKPDGYESSDVFQRDAQENIIYQIDPKTGAMAPVFSDVMKTLSQKGKFPKKVKQVLDAFLADPAVAQQMQIDAEYNYRGYDSYSLVGILQDEKNEQVQQIVGKVYDLQLQKALEPNVKTRDEIDIVISRMKDSIQVLDKQYENVLNSAMSNPDAVKGMLYSTKMRNAWTNMYTEIEEKTSYSVNPYFTTAMERQKEANRLAQWQAELAQKERHFNLNYQLQAKGVDLEARKLAFEMNEGQPKFSVDTMPGDIDFNSIYTANRNTAYKNYGTAVDDLIVSTVLNGYDWRAYLKVPGVTGPESAKRAMIDAMARQAGKDPLAFRAEYGNKALKEINRNPDLNSVYKLQKSSIENAVKNLEQFSIFDEYLNRVSPLSDKPTKDELARRGQEIQNKYMMYPNLTTELITGDVKMDKPRMEYIATLIGDYAKSHSNEGEGFRKGVNEMTLIANEPDKGSVSLKLGKDPFTGETTNKLAFYNEEGKFVGEMKITGDQVAKLNVSTTNAWDAPEVKQVGERMAVYGGRTSIGDPSETETYLMGDSFFTKSDFSLLGNVPYDIKANIESRQVVNRDNTVSTQYIPYLYINDGKNEPFVRALPAMSGMDEAVNALQNLNSGIIQQLFYERNS